MNYYNITLHLKLLTEKYTDDIFLRFIRKRMQTISTLYCMVFFLAHKVFYSDHFAFVSLCVSVRLLTFASKHSPLNPLWQY